MTYTTIQGDTWDTIARKTYGAGMESRAGDIMAANLPLLDFFIFPAGISVDIPAVAATDEAELPPWRAAADDNENEEDG